ncbi:MAG: hypothetical protein GX591_04710, partial [Planctomycetes bacterium]|nr:hypothetical protein [Planctomycetota bacterium]
MRVGPVEFASPWLLIGLLAAAIPPLLHLLSRRPARREPFPTLRFLESSAARTARRRRIRQWLLMALRCGLLAVLAVAAARLIVHTSGARRAGGPVAAVVVLDDSGSMAVANRFNEAVSSADRWLTGPGAPAAAALILATQPREPAVLTGDLHALREALAAVRPRPRRADLAAAVAAAAQLLAGSDLPDRRIYLVSDLQAASAEGLDVAAATAEAAGAALLIADAGGGRTGGTGLTDLTVEGRRVVDQPLAIAGRLHNNGTAPLRATVRLEVDGRSVQRRIVTADPAGAPAAVRFEHTFAAPGEHTGRLVLEDVDDAILDGALVFAAAIRPRARALVVAADGAAPLHADPGRVLEAALDPRTDPSMPWSLRVTRTDPASLDDADLRQADLVVLADVPAPSAAQAAALDRWVAAGGSLVWFAGPGVDVDATNRRLGPLLGGALGGPVGRGDPALGAVALAEVAADHPFWAGVDLGGDAVGRILAYRHLAFAPDEAAVTLARLASGAPLLVERRHGRGRVVVCTTTASMAWTNLPSVGMALFVPMLERAGLAAVDPAAAPPAWTAGDPATIDLPSRAAAGATVEILDDEGGTIDTARVTVADGRPVASITAGDAPGLLRWRIPGGDEGVIAVNAEAGEVDLRRIDGAALAALVEGGAVLG